MIIANNVHFSTNSTLICIIVTTINDSLSIIHYIIIVETVIDNLNKIALLFPLSFSLFSHFHQGLTANLEFHYFYYISSGSPCFALSILSFLLLPLPYPSPLPKSLFLFSSLPSFLSLPLSSVSPPLFPSLLPFLPSPSFPSLSTPLPSLKQCHAAGGGRREGQERGKGRREKEVIVVFPPAVSLSGGKGEGSGREGRRERSLWSSLQQCHEVEGGERGEKGHCGHDPRRDLGS